MIGSAGQQIAILADTILASGMPTGSVASINYADRLYQLPLGVIGVAAGTVLLPEMTRRLAAGDPHGAARAQNRSIALSLALCGAVPGRFPDDPGGADSRRLYARRVRRPAPRCARPHVLEAYGFGLIPMVLIRSAVATFQSRGDTETPMMCFFAGLAFNVALKLALPGRSGPSGWRIGTAVGAWINFGLLIWSGRDARATRRRRPALREYRADAVCRAPARRSSTPPALCAFADVRARICRSCATNSCVAATFGGVEPRLSSRYTLAARCCSAAACAGSCSDDCRLAE